MVTVEDGQLAQRMSALQLANEICSHRSALKRELRGISAPAGRTKVAGLLQDPDGWLEGMQVGELLCAARGFGVVRAGQMLRRSRIAPRTLIGELSETQRLALRLELTAGGPHA